MAYGPQSDFRTSMNVAQLVGVCSVAVSPELEQVQAGHVQVLLVGFTWVGFRLQSHTGAVALPPHAASIRSSGAQRIGISLTRTRS